MKLLSHLDLRAWTRRAAKPGTSTKGNPLRVMLERWRRDAGKALSSRRDPLGTYDDGRRVERHQLCRDHADELERALEDDQP